VTTLGVSGLWHLGCVLCASWAGLGCRVVGHDPDAARVEALRAGRPPLFEPGLPQALRHPALSFSTAIADLRGCEFVFLALDTPVDEEDRSLTRILEERTLELGSALDDGAIVVVSAQTPVGLCAHLRRLLQQGNPTLELACSPENLRLGEALANYLRPGRIVLGTADPDCERRCRQLLGRLEGEILAMSLESAEMVKHGINSFLATSIVFANQLADLCEVCGADLDDVVRGMRSDPRIGARAYLDAGLGFSGGTLGRDLRALSARTPAHQEDFFGYVWELNRRRKDHLLARLQERFGPLAGRRVAVLGLTYKPGTSTLRRSLPLEIVGELERLGARPVVYDPQADYAELGGAPPFEVARALEEAVAGSDLVLLLTPWPEFRQAPWEKLASTMKRPRLFDAARAVDPPTLRQAGFQFAGIGR
jgi:UDPglucose 6-dehydrogenase